MEEYDERTVVALADAAFNFIILRRTYTIKNPWYWRTTGLDGVLTTAHGSMSGKLQNCGQHTNQDTVAFFRYT